MNSHASLQDKTSVIKMTTRHQSCAWWRHRMKGGITWTWRLEGCVCRVIHVIGWSVYWHNYVTRLLYDDCPLNELIGILYSPCVEFSWTWQFSSNLAIIRLNRYWLDISDHCIGHYTLKINRSTQFYPSYAIIRRTRSHLAATAAVEIRRCRTWRWQIFTSFAFRVL